MPLIFVALGALANFFAGMDNVKWLPGRNIYYSAVVIGIIAGATLGPSWGIALLLSCLAWRLPGWYDSLDIGRDAQTVGRDAAVMTIRGLFFAPVFIWRAYVDHNWGYLSLLGAAALLITVIYAFGNWVVRPHYNPFPLIDLGVGAVWGYVVLLLWEVQVA